jgi:HEAT repeat protein
MRDPSSRRWPLVFATSVLLVVLLVWGVGSYLDWGGRDETGTLKRGLDRSEFTAQAVPGQIRALKDPDAAVRTRAATALWQIGVYAKDATPELLAIAKDAHPEVREAVAKALGRTSQGTQDALPALIEALKDKEAGVRAAAAASLTEIWIADKQSAGSETSSPARPGPRSSSAPPVIPLSPKSEKAAQPAIPLLTVALRDPDARVRGHVAAALAETGLLAQPAVDELVHIIDKDTDDNARLQAVLALGNIGPGARAAVPVMVKMVRHEKVDGIRVNTAAGLGMIRCDAEKVVPALVEAFLKDEHPDVRTWAMISIDQFGPEGKIALPALKAAAAEPKTKEDPELQRRITRLIARLEGKPLSPDTTPSKRSGPKR